MRVAQIRAPEYAKRGYGELMHLGRRGICHQELSLTNKVRVGLNNSGGAVLASCVLCVKYLLFRASFL